LKRSLSESPKVYKLFSFTRKPLILDQFTPDKIRNFAIIAHVDHGKSTLADRLLEYTGAIAKCGLNAQVLDKLSVERERGITVKAQSAALMCPFEGQTYLLNLIDTPGHSDFSYEVKRSLVACDNAVLLVDASEGVMAQTLATFHFASSRGLKVVPVLNKIDLPTANPEKVKEQLKSLLSIEPRDVLTVSAKLGKNVEDIITTLIMEGKSPKVADALDNGITNCVIIDSEHHAFRGTVVTILVRGGVLSKGMEFRLLRNDRVYKVKEVGIFAPDERPVEALYAGQVGFATMGIKSPSEVITGDVFYSGEVKPTAVDYVEPTKPMVYAGVFPVHQGKDHQDLGLALEKLCLNDPSAQCSPENHPALGAGWRLGFLGLLHMDVFRQRLEDEYGATVILTAPSVSYRCNLLLASSLYRVYFVFLCILVKIRGKKNIQRYGGEWIFIKSYKDKSIFLLRFHSFLQPDSIVEAYEEMHVRGTVVVPEQYLSAVLKLCVNRRGKLLSQDCLDGTRLYLAFDFPLSEIIFDFSDKLKAASSGFASFIISVCKFNLSVHLNGKPIEELTQLVPKANFLARARALADGLAKEIPRQQFLIRVQVLAGARPVAKADIKPYRKDVTAKLHAADPSRYNKLLSRQAEGKKRLRMIGEIFVPRDAFINVLKRPL
uniref:Translation factor GUF1 homolog, mitochondrial n=1 Tax=Hymenolepis diminuta TaxID=6216 RepID=A0A0R3SPD1_HYMDI